MVNNQLSVLGGSETYMFSIGEELTNRGHDVQYFGTPDPDRRHGNSFHIYAKRSLNPFSFKINRYNVKQFAKILDLFEPDIVHINLMYFVLTPEIINEASKRNIPIVHTVHDPKIVCPNHRLYISQRNEPCMRCLNNGLNNCVKNKCIKNSGLLSRIAVDETEHYRKKGLYKKIDIFIFPSLFMKNIHIGHDVDEKRSVVIHNFSRIKKETFLDNQKFDDKYVLYFGRVSTEKGMSILADVIKNTPNIKYKIAGDGDCKNLFEHLDNCELLGFLSGGELVKTIKNASICVFPSIWYENCPMSVLESKALGTPPIGARIGGIPELIEDGETGFLHNPADSNDLRLKIETLFFNDDLLKQMSENCVTTLSMEDLGGYISKLEKIYCDLINQHKS